MTAVRRLLLAAGLAGVLCVAAGGSAWADPTPSADPSATASPAASPAPSETPSTEPSPGPTAGGCDANPEICQSGGAPNTTTDCGQVGPGGQPASPPPPGTVCIASGLNPGNPNEVTAVGAGSGTPRTLPRTGPIQLLPSLVLGSWLLLLGVAVGLAGRRRAAGA
ncbi:MAG: hypothetical protein QOJ79_1820 [Actinomycetota bacterium]|nr:hypothetical protein [Actinomycetota bacterium]